MVKKLLLIFSLLFIFVYTCIQLIDHYYENKYNHYWTDDFKIEIEEYDLTRGRAAMNKATANFSYVVDGKKYRNTSSIINCSWWIRDHYSSVYRWTRWSGGRYIVDPTIFYEESKKYKFLKVYVDKEDPYLPCLIVDNKFEFK